MHKTGNRAGKLLAGMIGLGLGLLVAQGASPAGKVDFSKDVLPILSDKCFHCHGPDDSGRKAKLRLDTQEGAFRVKDGVANIVKGKPEQSEIIVRVLSKDEDELMPPPSSHRTLTEEQKQTLKRWVEQGAPWGKHWAFVALPKAVMPPKVKNKRAGPEQG
jgi:mono/diheme cytochrome c family protein